MKIPGKIRFAAERLHSGYRVNRITVRDFLRHFGAERRGASKIESIRRILDDLSIETDPDFTTAWIDAPMWLRLKDGVAPTSYPNSGEPKMTDLEPESINVEDIVLEGTPAAVEEAEEQVKMAPISVGSEISIEGEYSHDISLDDPTFRIGSLPAANKTLVVVSQNDFLTKAVTLMLQHDFDQLPVMHGEREVKGVITWKSIAAKKTLGKCETVADCREDPRIVDSNRTLFDAIPTIVEYGYVLVRDQRDRKITGIVTASDLSLQFQALAEPFLLLREVELHVRQLLGDKVSQEDLSALNNPILVPQCLGEVRPQDRCWSAYRASGRSKTYSQRRDAL
jgi:CBS domain-containing protein